VSLEQSLEWNLENLFSDKDQDEDFFNHLKEISNDLIKLEFALNNQDMSSCLSYWQIISASLRQGFSYIACLGVEEKSHPYLLEFQQKLIELQKKYGILNLKFDSFWGMLPEKKFNQWIDLQEIRALAQVLKVRRKHYHDRLELKQNDTRLLLSQEIFSPLAEQYQSMIHRMRFKGLEGDSIDMIQAVQLIKTSEPVLRQKIFKIYEEQFKMNSSFFCDLINQMFGCRLELAKSKKNGSPLAESLEIQKLNLSSINCMWEVVNDRKACLILFFSKKAALFKHKKPTWTDLWANLIQKNRTPLRINDASNWMQAALSRLDSEVGQFAKKLVTSGCVSSHSLNAIGVSSCTLPLPLKKTVRIFLGYQDGIDRLTDYTRQMASAWRYHILFDQPEILQQCPTVVCEALSSFCERLVLEVVKERSFTRQQQFDALFSHMQRAAINVLDMQTRFEFESQLFKERTEGCISETKLCQLMIDSQQNAYANQLEEYFPYYWASREQFFTSQAASFQNYNYTAGFLLGLGLYQHYCDHPADFYVKIKAWIKACCGSQNVEEPLAHYFGVHLGQDKIWRDALALLEEDVRLISNLIDIKDKTFSLEMRSD
jgi:oligoendopeptidase F